VLIAGLQRIIVIAGRSPHTMAVRLSIPMELEHLLLAPMLNATPRDERVRSMVKTQLFMSAPSWIKPVAVISLALLVSFGCKEQSSSTPPPPSGGMPPPPSGGMPAPPSGGMPPPPSPGSGSPGDSGTPAPPSPSDGSQGDGSDSGPTGSSEGGDESGEIGSFPGEEADGPPPMPGTGGAGEGAEAGGQESTSGGGESEDSSDWDEESESNEECGDTGSLPGGVGGMGQDGECISGGASAADSDSSSESSSSGGGEGGSSDGEESAVQGTGGAGEVAEFPTESDEERAERLGQELDESIGGFDQVLMEEQQEISSVGRNTEGFGEGVEGDGGISLGQQATSGGGITVANNRSLPQSSIGNMTDDQIRERTPEDIPIMVDDDIIARQLREAALSEEDPVLRARLWEEYRKYSGN
jgi:hypothetical protein